MKLAIDPRLPVSESVGPLKARLYELFRLLSQQVNALSEGSIDALHQAMTTAPTTGKWKQGDFITNSAPSELGTTGSKYVISGWLCVSSGEPGTWVQSRTLTGN